MDQNIALDRPDCIKRDERFSKLSIAILIIMRSSYDNIAIGDSGKLQSKMTRRADVDQARETVSTMSAKTFFQVGFA